MKLDVYILDDDVQFTGMLQRIAESFDYKVRAFNRAQAFLVHSPQSGVLILDLKMPDCDGIEVIRTLAERKSKLQLILMSGYDDGVLNSAKTLAAALGLEVLASFTKPIDVHKLKRVLDDSSAQVKSNHNHPGNEILITQETLKTALCEGQLYLEYQPQMSLKKQQIVSFEALVRWQHPEYGTVYPDVFIPVAEESGLISDLTKNVISMAFQQLAQWQEQKQYWHVAINISAKDLLSMDLPGYLAECEAQYQVPAQKVMLELTETAATGSLAESLEILNRLRLRGYRLSVDDFGTGYSSLSKLHDAPFNELKIDRRFVSSLLHDEKAMAIVKTCAALAKMLGLQVVAEGAEDLATVKALEEMHCDLVQGYYIGKPMNIEQIKECYRDAS
ncbi:EAL domain-containing response regulator [Planctobacterium marinum]|uniref:Signal transduction protein n=1 Tax=Planctobacterium marinum TaxID=1631968 RepID=A0AA48HJX5_9ALTE|nr:signal transduction protein [Planctobacterium marinum]